MSLAIRAVTFPIPDSVFARELTSGILEGFCVDICKKICEDLKSVCNISAVSPAPLQPPLLSSSSTGSSTSAPNINNQSSFGGGAVPWTAMLQQLEDGSADMVAHHVGFGFGGSRFHEPNSSVILTPPFMVSGFQAAVAYEVDSTDFLLLLRPFARTTWLVILAVWIILALSLTTISFMRKKRNLMEPDEEFFSLRQSIWFFWASFMQMNVDKEPRFSAGKMLSSVWSVFALVVIATYTANLAALFGNTLTRRPLQSVVDIPESSRDLVTYQSFGKESAIGMLRLLSDKKDKISYVQKHDLAALKKEVCQHRKIAVLPDVLMHPLLHDNKDCDKNGDKTANNNNSNVSCCIYTLNGFFNLGTFSFALRKNWSLSSNVSKLFRHYARSGVFEDLRRKNDAVLLHPPGNPSIKIPVAGFSGIFFFVLSGIVLAFCVTGSEMIWKRKKVDSKAACG